MTFIEQLRDMFWSSEVKVEALQMLDVVPPGERVRYVPCCADDVEEFGNVIHMAATAVGRTARILVFKDGKRMDIPGPLMIVEVFNQVFDKPSEMNLIGGNPLSPRSPDNAVVYRSKELPSDPQELKKMVQLFLLIKPECLDRVIMTTSGALAETSIPVTEGGGEVPLFSGKKGVA